MKESQVIEWKETWRDEYVKWICGFANVKRKRPMRSGSTNQLLKGAALERFLMRKHGRTWDSAPLPNVGLKNLSNKDYASSVPVQISVYADKLMIWNPGQLPTNWTIERLLAKHPSEPFNPQIAGAFFRAGVIESWGRGVERIVAACRIEGRPDPEFQMEATGVWVTFPFGEPPKTTPETEKTTPETEITSLQKTREKLLTLLQNEPSMGRQNLARHLGLSIDGVKYQLNRLRALGIIRHTGSSKAGAWHIVPTLYDQFIKGKT